MFVTALNRRKHHTGGTDYNWIHYWAYDEVSALTGSGTITDQIGSCDITTLGPFTEYTLDGDDLISSSSTSVYGQFDPDDLDVDLSTDSYALVMGYCYVSTISFGTTRYAYILYNNSGGYPIRASSAFSAAAVKDSTVYDQETNIDTVTGTTYGFDAKHMMIITQDGSDAADGHIHVVRSGPTVATQQGDYAQFASGHVPGYIRIRPRGGCGVYWAGVIDSYVPSTDAGSLYTAWRPQ